MMYGLYLDENRRIICATFEKYAADGIDLVDKLPDGNLRDYRYVDGKYVYDPLPEPETDPELPSQLDRIEAQALYTALMTDTLIDEV